MTPQLEEAARQALEALDDLMGWQTLAPADTQRTAHKASTALRAALEQEPVVPLGNSYPGLPWDEIPDAFNKWWDSDYDPTGNPYSHETPAYWAWAGWKAALEQPAQDEPVAYGMWDTQLGRNRMMMVRLDKGQDGCTVPLYAKEQA